MLIIIFLALNEVTLHESSEYNIGNEWFRNIHGRYYSKSNYAMAWFLNGKKLSKYDYDFNIQFDGLNTLLTWKINENIQGNFLLNINELNINDTFYVYGKYFKLA